MSHFAKFAAEVLIFRSSRSLMFFKVRVLENFAALTGKHLCWPCFTENLRWLLLDFHLSKYLFFCWIWYILLTVAPDLAANSFENKPLQFFLRNFANFTGKHLCLNLKFLWNFKKIYKHLIWVLQTTASETYSFTWTVLLITYTSDSN